MGLEGGNSADAFRLEGPIITTTSTNRFDQNYVGSAIGPQNNTGKIHIENFVDGPIADFWLRYDHYTFNDPDGDDAIVFYDNADNPFVRLDTNNGSYLMQVEYWDGGGWVELVEISAAPLSSRVTTWNWNIVCGATGKIQLRWDDDIIVDESVDLTAFTEVAHVALGNMRDGGAYYSQVIWGDEPTVNHNYYERRPTGDGAHTDGVGTYADVDETGYSDADLVTLSGVGDKQSFVHSAFTIDPTKIVKAVMVNGRVSYSAGAAENIKGLLRIGGVDYVQAAEFVDMDLSYRGYRSRWEQNPALTAAWTNADAEAVTKEFGFEAAT